MSSNISINVASENDIMAGSFKAAFQQIFVWTRDFSPQPNHISHQSFPSLTVGPIPQVLGLFLEQYATLQSPFSLPAAKGTLPIFPTMKREVGKPSS